MAKSTEEIMQEAHAGIMQNDVVKLYAHIMGYQQNCKAFPGCKGCPAMVGESGVCIFGYIEGYAKIKCGENGPFPTI
jgi:hypothetical protein